MREEVYELEDPVEVSGNKVLIVRLKRPDFDLICELGLPADCSSQQEQLKLLREYVIRLSGLPKETVGRFGVADSMKLKGICFREKPGMTEDELYRVLMMFKEADINYLRSIYGPFGRTMLCLCDELGFWVEDTAPLYGVGDSRPATQNSPAHLESD